MDKQINKKIVNYITNFKTNIKETAINLDLKNNPDMITLLQYVCDYESLNLSKEDFMKRKRVKNTVDLPDRCCAKRSNGEQCTRRRKNENEYCGTHLKGTPHGICNVNSVHNLQTEGYKIEVWVQDIKGIMYYIDKNFNVYRPEDIISNSTNPLIINRYEIRDGIYYVL